MGGHRPNSIYLRMISIFYVGSFFHLPPITSATFEKVMHVVLIHVLCHNKDNQLQQMKYGRAWQRFSRIYLEVKTVGTLMPYGEVSRETVGNWIMRKT